MIPIRTFLRFLSLHILHLFEIFCKSFDKNVSSLHFYQDKNDFSFLPDSKPPISSSTHSATKDVNKKNDYSEKCCIFVSENHISHKRALTEPERRKKL